MNSQGGEGAMAGWGEKGPTARSQELTFTRRKAGRNCGGEEIGGGSTWGEKCFGSESPAKSQVPL